MINIHAKKTGVPAWKLPVGIKIFISGFSEENLQDDSEPNDKMIGETSEGEKVRFWFRHFVNFTLLENLRPTSHFFQVMGKVPGVEYFQLPEIIEVTGQSPHQKAIVKLSFNDSHYQELYQKYIEDE